MAPKRPLIDTDPRLAGLRRRLIPQRPPAPAGDADAWDDARAALALDRCADGFVSVDERGRVIAWNPACERIFGWRAADALGRRLADLAVPERLRAEYERTLAAFAAATPSCWGGRSRPGRSAEAAARSRSSSRSRHCEPPAAGATTPGFAT